MKALTASLIALTVLAGPAMAWGPSLQLPILTFPQSDPVVSSQQPDTVIIDPAK